MIYRPEIDGLRCVAVIPVILFHAGLPLFSGGYVGVDVFFVISGYLITSIILSDLEADRFSIRNFYERRARRILPALVFVLIFSLPFAYIWMLPGELIAFGKSLIATVFFGSNILFWRESDYFGAAAELKPLLHTWSLAVEEQFYLFFPPIFAFLVRRRKMLLIPTMLVTILASLALAEWGARHAPSATFYLLPTRLWELLIGSLLAVYSVHSVRQVPKLLANSLSFVGLSLVMLAIFGFNSYTPMPSVWTLVPVVGTALILGFAHKQTWTARLLSMPPLVGIGLISYSAYLWHQPVLAFARIRLITEPDGILLIGILVLTFFLAWLSWRFVEQPFRGSSPLLEGGQSIGLATVATIAIVTLIGATLIIGDGLDGRRTPSGSNFSDFADFDDVLAPNYGLHPDCDVGQFTLSPNCRTSDEPVLALWGDSFAMHLAQALQVRTSSPSMVQLTLSQCGPIPNLAAQGSITSWQDCLGFNDSALNWILNQPSIRTVVISSPFDQTLRDLRDRNGNIIADPDVRRDAISNELTSLSTLLASVGKNLIVVSPPPRTGADLGLCFVRNHLMGNAVDTCDFPVEDHHIFSFASRHLLQVVSQTVRVVWLENFLCEAGTCRVTLDGVPVYRDVGHLSVDGSTKLGATFDLLE
ncbi:acyltransferase [Aliiroseovarius sp. S1123]|uniref:acyltransferase family protein n=1 Tax=Aliiroseovarius sp. S1123 TaxID=2926404 RepID=UPI001FF6DB35|nr:acyltransferase family protein [Aliiroseovarius sp. S1123]MCK0171444.1 acyltransferase [Aliiroseovarius sp. S1123]